MTHGHIRTVHSSRPTRVQERDIGALPFASLSPSGADMEGLNPTPAASALSHSNKPLPTWTSWAHEMDELDDEDHVPPPPPARIGGEAAE